MIQSTSKFNSKLKKDQSLLSTNILHILKVVNLMKKPSLTTSRSKYCKPIKSHLLCWLKKGHTSHHWVSTPTKGGNALVGVDTYQREYCFGRC